MSGIVVDYQVLSIYAVFSFISGLRYGPGLSNALDSTRLASIWVQYMLLDEACVYYLPVYWLVSFLTIFTITHRFSLRHGHVHYDSQQPC